MSETLTRQVPFLRAFTRWPTITPLERKTFTEHTLFEREDHLRGFPEAPLRVRVTERPRTSLGLGGGFCATESDTCVVGTVVCAVVGGSDVVVVVVVVDDIVFPVHALVLFLSSMCLNKIDESIRRHQTHQNRG